MHRILVADDSSTVRNVVIHAFRGTDVEVLEAASGEDALEVARRELPDLVLCDVLMVGMTGYEVAEALAADPATSRIPVLLLTGPFEPFDEERATRSGAVGYLAKPFEPRVLVERVRSLLGGDAARASAGRRPVSSGTREVLDAPPPPPPPAPAEPGPLRIEPSREEATCAPPPAHVPLPGDVDFDAGPPPTPPPPGAPGKELEAEVRRIVERIAPEIVREIAWEVVPDLFERLLRERGARGAHPPVPPGEQDR